MKVYQLSIIVLFMEEIKIFYENEKTKETTAIAETLEE